ncbi:LamG domain-containing protein [Candidatus Poribacteria bacterium]|nr:LamG domain-containing protein [Candidatus Poribacteria bacterium]
MVINFRLLLIVMLLFHLVLPVFSFKPSGGVLVLDGDNDYAILSLVEHGYLIPANTFDFTVEIWFYPKSGPKRGENNLILSQQVRFGLTSNTQDCNLDKNQLCCHGVAHLEGKVKGVIALDVEIEKDQWNYLAVIFKDGAFNFAYNNRILQTRFPLVNRVAAEVQQKQKDFFVGGYDKDVFTINQDGIVLSQTTYFHGEIDAIRFSNIARYDLPAKKGIEPFDPPHRFESDEHTLALWNFDEPAGADRFRDASGNRKTLIGMNGATTSGSLAVSPNSASLTTTWGRIKSEPR